ncbi:hypothetical protein [Anaeromassilibacillus sp. An200]|mgnify:FL=1|uniref:Uncharacterized protein n=1 Tax=Candidatus Caccousia stercoris TaxID=2840723 RepID=A0A9D1K3Q0_9FIRM|nr:hypothetical protein [Anaeromassilibacillus sp. An200]OUP14093.1 hypothetical protein B5F35_01945 [Anaeromassilibacillus sp. An200]HIS79403.1 hypothetical protein [Candidatus Caccousia stercoris]
MTRTVGQASWNGVRLEYLVAQDDAGSVGVEIRETVTRSVFASLFPAGPGNFEKAEEFAKRLADGLVFADNLPELAEDFRMEQSFTGA